MFIYFFGEGHEKDINPSFHVMTDSSWKFPRLSFKCKAPVLWTNPNLVPGFLHYVFDASPATQVLTFALKKGNTMHSASTVSINFTLAS